MPEPTVTSPRQPSRPAARPAPAARGGFTLLEALIASVIVAMVAATASVSVAVGAAVEQQNRASVVAMQAAELQLGSLMELRYEDMASQAGTEPAGAMLAPLRPGASVRVPLPGAFAGLSRTTTVTAENRSFAQYNAHVVEGARIEVTVTGPDGSVLARLVRFRGQDPQT
ncbi:MAG: prepilin-type N-terminal cleavage/methylation domain-containing protein [Chloroflexota bacterium]